MICSKKYVEKKCLLIIPGIRSLANKERFTTVYEFPRGALSLGTFLEANGCSVALLPLDYHLTLSSYPEVIEAQTRSAVESAIREYEPLLVGISVPYTMLYPASLKIVEFCKNLRPGLISVLGGPHVSYQDRQAFIDSDTVDIVVKGEGEWTLLELMDCIEKGRELSEVKGTTCRKNGKIISNPLRPLGNINELPVLDYRLLPDRFVRNMAVSLVAGRGCAYKCTYCNESVFWGNKVRHLPVDNILHEIKQLAENYGNYPVGLEDSMFHMRSSYFFDLCSKLSRTRLHTNFYILSRVDCVSEEGFEAMIKAGIRNIVMGIESASLKVLEAMNKGITLKGAEAACRKAAEKGLVVGTFWIIGHPGDNPREAETTINAIDRFYSERIMHTSEIAIFVPYPGTDIYDHPDKYGVKILARDWERWGRFNTEPVFELEEFKKDEIIRAWNAARKAAERGMRYRARPVEIPYSEKIPSLIADTASLNFAVNKVGRNSPCPCGSGKKYKKCCGRQGGK